MSIINDAIKRARKEFEIKNKPAVALGEKTENILQKVTKSTDTRWKIIIAASLVFIASLSGSMFLYRYMSRPNVGEHPTDTTLVEESSPSVDLSQIYPRSHLPTLKYNSVLELNGIVYGPTDRWAIINNKIVREGDSLLDGQVKIIARDFVKIKKLSGEEIVLELE